MITKFETRGSSVPQSGSSGGSGLVYLIVGAVAIYLAYQYILKPEMNKRKAEDLQPLANEPN
jgi:hypothetical protein